MTWKKLELKNKDTLMCDICKKMMNNTIMYVYINDSNDYVNEVRCGKCI